MCPLGQCTGGLAVFGALPCHAGTSSARTSRCRHGQARECTEQLGPLTGRRAAGQRRKPLWAVAQRGRCTRSCTAPTEYSADPSPQRVRPTWAAVGLRSQDPSHTRCGRPAPPASSICCPHKPACLPELHPGSEGWTALLSGGHSSLTAGPTTRGQTLRPDALSLKVI